MKGRRVPPPFVPVTKPNPSIEQMAAATAGKAGVFMLRFAHNDGCKTIRTQRWKDCSCGDDVDHRLLRYDDVESEDVR